MKVERKEKQWEIVRIIIRNNEILIILSSLLFVSPLIMI